MGRTRIFFPQEALDQWLYQGRIELSEDRLKIIEEDREYKVLEGVRVVAEVTGLPDVHELSGKVKTVNFLLELGAELLGTSMVIGENAYDVVPGWLGAPVGAFVERKAQASGMRKSRGSIDQPQTDEELLAQFLMRHLY